MNSKVLDVELREVSLDDKYTLERGQVYLTGIQALVRLVMMQSASDRRVGLNTAGFISGYRGSPLGGLDQQLLQVTNLLQERNIRFLPAVNEELAATSIWGSQQAELGGRGRVSELGEQQWRADRLYHRKRLFLCTGRRFVWNISQLG